MTQYQKVSYTLIAKNEGDDDSKAWREPGMSYPLDENETIEDAPAEEHAKSIILYFNGTMKPGEKPRELVGVEDVIVTDEEYDEDADPNADDDEDPWLLVDADDYESDEDEEG